MSISRHSRRQLTVSSGSIHDLATDGDLEGLRAVSNLSASVNLKDDYVSPPCPGLALIDDV